jgi:hypothetical protein
MTSDALAASSAVPPSGPGRGWRAAAYAAAIILAAGVSACVAGIPLSLTDFTAYLIDAEPYSLGELFIQRSQTPHSFRPMFWVQMKAIFDLSGGAYFPAFKAFHIAHIVATLVLCVRLLQVRTAAGFVAALVVITAIIGLHTTINTLREGPMTMPLSIALALNLASGDRTAWWRDLGAVLLLLFASLTVELGLLLWVIYAGAHLVGWRGVSRRGVAAASAVVAGYLAYRLFVLGAADMEFRGTGLGLTPREPEELQALFGGWMVLLYAHNVAVSVLTVLFSEPREGVWWLVREATQGQVSPWLWINLTASALTTLCLAWFIRTRASSWRRRTCSDGDRLVLLALAVLAANAVISFAYARDVVMQPAGMMYALAAYPALVAALEHLPSVRVSVRVVAVAALCTIAVTWSARAVGTMHVLRDTAFDKRNDWADAVDFLRGRGGMPTDHRQEIVFRLRRHALDTNVPVPALAQPWAERWTDRLY